MIGVAQGGFAVNAGWVNVTSGAVVPDPRGNLVDVRDVPVGAGGTSPQWGLQAQPSLLGEASGSYSPKLGRWLPARPEMVAPDGRHYAYMAPDGPTHVVDSVSGSDHALAHPADLGPIGYGSAGIWLVQGPGYGLWLLDPATGSASGVLAPDPKQAWLWMWGGAIWGQDSAELPGSPAPTALLHFDLATRSVSTWYAQAGMTVRLAAVDQTGAALVVVGQGESSRALSITGAGQSTPVTLPPGVSADALVGGVRPETDSHGGWIFARSGMFLFTASSDVQRTGPTPTGDIIPAGECL